jgi:hypothetical protein
MFFLEPFFARGFARRRRASTAKAQPLRATLVPQNWNASRVFGCSRIPVFEESMKPALETPNGVSTDPYSKTVCCLRCEQKLQRYQLMKASLAPGNSGHAILSCPRCGHVEFVSDSSPLLQNLELVSVDAGDGD